MTPRRLVLLVEGDGDVLAAPVLVKRIVAEQGGFDAVSIDAPIRVGEFGKLAKNDYSEWRRFLGVAAKRKNIAGCVLLIDGDCSIKIKGKQFCCAEAAHLLAAKAEEEGAGKIFSVAVVFACVEFESWLIAGAASLAGKKYSDGRAELPAEISPPTGDLELAPRAAKEWLGRKLLSGYSPTRDQAELTKLVDLQSIRDRPMRSFRRLENAVQQMITAVRTGQHMVTPLQTSK